MTREMLGMAFLLVVELADLARIPGIKGIRARLYHDTGADMVERMAAWDPKAMRATVDELVEQTGFEGVGPLPGEARFSLARAGARRGSLNTEARSV